MLDNPIERESIKAVGAVGAVVAGGTVAAVLAITLGVAVEALGYLGEKRTKELFDTPELLNKTVSEIKKSDDFAGFVYDIWMKHNFESSETRRRRLKAILTHAVDSKDKDFENFTRLITAAQQIDDAQLKVLDVYYNKALEGDVVKDGGSAKLDGQRVNDYKISPIELAKILQKENLIYNHSDGGGLTPILNQLCYLGLISTYTAMNGEYYMPTALGKIFLEYIKG
jgi:hypothetical protein